MNLVDLLSKDLTQCSQKDLLDIRNQVDLFMEGKDPFSPIFDGCYIYRNYELFEIYFRDSNLIQENPDVKFYFVCKITIQPTVSLHFYSCSVMEVNDLEDFIFGKPYLLENGDNFRKIQNQTISQISKSDLKSKIDAL